MPEGDSIVHDRVRLVPILEGRRIVGAFSRWPGRRAGLEGRTVLALRTRGKHLLIDLDDQTTLRVHHGMTGSWRVLGPNESLGRSPGDVAIRLDTEVGAAICLKAPTVDRFRTRTESMHPVLSRLGPDVLAEDFEPRVAAARAIRSGKATCAEVLLDQAVACGVGNVYKAEVLFWCRRDPFAPPATVDEEGWTQLFTRAQTLMMANLAPGPRDTTRLGHGRPRHWVYGRRGRPCLRCGTRVSARRSGPDGMSRTTYWCPRCQEPRVE